MCLAMSGGILGTIAATSSGEQALVSGGDAATGRAQAGFDHPALLAFFLVLVVPARGRARAARSQRVAAPAVGGVRGAGGRRHRALPHAQRDGRARSLAAPADVPARVPPLGDCALTLAVAVFAAFNAQAIERSPQLAGDHRAHLDDQQEHGGDRRQPAPLHLVEDAGEIFGDHPFFGVGSTQFPLYAPRYDIVDYGGAPFMHAHDVPLTIAAENGLIGLAFLFAFGFAVTALGVRLVLRRATLDGYAFGVAAAAAVVAAFVTGLADSSGTVVLMGMTFLADRRAGRDRAPVAGPA